MSLIVTRGFGDDIIIEYVPVPIEEIQMSAHSWGEKQVKTEQVEDDE